MTHEQKPENAEFRTRRDQLAFYPSTVCVGRYPGNSWELGISEDDLDPDRLLEGPVMYVRCDIDHKRRKDAEGAERWEFEEPEYHAQGMGCGLEDRGIHDRYEAMAYGWDQAIERCIERIPEELYTRPANVAALIAEAVAAERERCAKMLDASAIHAEECGANWGERYAKHWAAAIRKGEQ